MAGRFWRTLSNGKRVRTAAGRKREYDRYQSSEEAKKDRASRNSARRSALKSGLVHRGDNREVHHRGSVRDNSNTEVISRKENRSKREKSRLKRSARNKRMWGK